MDMSEILAELDDHGFADTSSTRKVSTINDTYWDICAREDWPFLEVASSTPSTAVGVSALTMPTRFLRVIALSNTPGVFSLLYEDYENMAKLFPTLETLQGTPQYYYFLGSVIHLYPVPNAIVAMRLRYTTWPAELLVGEVEAGFIIPPRHHRALVLGALSKLYSMEDDLEQAQMFDTKFEERILHMKADLLRRRIESSKDRRARDRVVIDRPGRNVITGERSS